MQWAQMQTAADLQNCHGQQSYSLAFGTQLFCTAIAIQRPWSFCKTCVAMKFVDDDDDDDDLDHRCYLQ